ncbi:MAG: hypothetical protein KDB86_11815 [Actinobacteria bacterium]|nr:hypothetical protein [Actinomycetota bacterium]MCB9389289.1 hypothetical protein [Acidimicrobiia bacterium]
MAIQPFRSTGVARPKRFGSEVPATKAWVAERPGELIYGQPHGAMLGSPGPDQGYALTLLRAAKTWIQYGPHEQPHDGDALLSALAIRRAALFGRAPTMVDLKIAAAILGMDGNGAPAQIDWRTRVGRGAHHHLDEVHHAIDGVPNEVLKSPLAKISNRSWEDNIGLEV